MTSQAKVQSAKAWLDREDPRAQALTAAEVDGVRERLRDERLVDMARQAVLDEYKANGIDPVYADEGHTMLVSLAMMIHNGWRVVETPDGERRLAR